MAYRVKITPRLVGSVSLVLWLASLALPAAVFNSRGYEYVPGAFVALFGLAFGWFEQQPGAFANLILIFIIITLLVQRKPKLWLVMTAEILAIWSFTWRDFPDDINQNPIVHFSYGFYAWQLAIFLPTIYAVSNFYLEAGRETTAKWNSD